MMTKPPTYEGITKGKLTITDQVRRPGRSVLTVSQAKGSANRTAPAVTVRARANVCKANC